MSLSPAAIAIIFNTEKTQILLVKRKDIPIWVLPGGGVEDKESPEDAVVREVEEETGLVVEIERKCGEYTPVNRLAAFTTVFICRIKSGNILSSTSETASTAFFALDQLPPLFFKIHQSWLKDALEYSHFVQKPLTAITYIEFLKYFFRHPWMVTRYLFTRFFSKN